MIFTWWCVGVYAPLAPPLIFIEYTNELSNRMPINTLIRLESNLYKI
jgi:hypothetical protein